MIANFGRHYGGINSPGSLNGLFVGIQKADAVRAKLEVLLEVALDACAQLVV
jgi:hypothetical protein